MTRQIWKYPVVGPQFMLRMPDGARVLSIQNQQGSPQMWVLVDPDSPGVHREFLFYGTGHTMPDDPGEFIGTFQVADGDLVFHLFERTKQGEIAASPEDTLQFIGLGDRIEK